MEWAPGVRRSEPPTKEMMGGEKSEADQTAKREAAVLDTGKIHARGGSHRPADPG